MESGVEWLLAKATGLVIILGFAGYAGAKATGRYINSLLR